MDGVKEYIHTDMHTVTHMPTTVTTPIPKSTEEVPLRIFSVILDMKYNMIFNQVLLDANLLT
jgi:hypothetical protein